jgi:hypothetical protein
MLRRLDQTSVKPKLLIFGNSRYNSKIGYFMSGLSMITILVFIVYFFVAFFERRDLNVIYYRNQNYFLPNINLNNTFIMYYMHDGGNNPIDPRVAQVTPVYNKWDNKVLKNEIMQSEPCSWEKHFKDPIYQEMFKFNISMYSCIDVQKYNISLTNDLNTGLKRQFSLNMIKCQNTTSNGNSCYAPDLINGKLKALNLWFDYYLPSYTIDHYNLDQPMTNWYYSKNFKISADFYYIFWEYFKMVNYESDDGSVFEDISPYSGFIYDDSMSTKDVLGPETSDAITGTFAVVKLTNNSLYTDRYKRFYPKLQTVVANIGGITKLVLFFAKFVTILITKQMMYFDLARCIISTSSATEKTLSFAPIQNNFIEDKDASDNNIASNLEAHKKVKEMQRPRKLRRLRVLDVICPCRNKSTKFLNDSEWIVKRYLSLDIIMKSQITLERLKQVLLTEKQYGMFRYMRNPTVHEHEDIKAGKETKLSCDISVSDQLNPENEVDKKILKYCL